MTRARSLVIAVGDPHLHVMDRCWRALMRSSVERGKALEAQLDARALAKLDTSRVSLVQYLQTIDAELDARREQYAMSKGTHLLPCSPSMRVIESNGGDTLQGIAMARFGGEAAASAAQLRLAQEAARQAREQAIKQAAADMSGTGGAPPSGFDDPMGAG